MARKYVCPEKRTAFGERSSRKTVSFEEQIISKDICVSIFSRKMEAIVFIILQIFFNEREKCLGTDYRLRSGMFTFQCSLIRFCELKKKQNIFLLPLNAFSS